MNGDSAPWSADPILRNYRFTNAYRASDRVSQYLIGKVLYNDQSQDAKEIFLRTILFRLFNKSQTWALIEAKHGPITVSGFNPTEYEKTLTNAKEQGRRIYSSAYIIPPVASSRPQPKHVGHLRLIADLLDRDFSHQLEQADGLADLYRNLRSVPSLGPFLAFQLTIDLNYSNAFNFDEDDFVVAGPGAHDGIAKCFARAKPAQARDIIEMMRDRQEAEFERLGLAFRDLGGRRLKSIDCQNLFCEISKYARVAHPEIQGVSGRTRIKQVFQPVRDRLTLNYPPKWGVQLHIPPSTLLPNDLFD